MSGRNYCSKESDLCSRDRRFLVRYRDFQDLLRKQNESPLDASSLEEHLEIINYKKISTRTEQEFISELMRYHGWACSRDEFQRTHDERLIDLVLSYEDLRDYCKFREHERGVKLWSLNKICQAVISCLKFMKAKDNVDTSDMHSKTRDLYNAIARCAKKELTVRPSLCERREKGEALNFMDVINVCNGQYLRVKALISFKPTNLDSSSPDVKYFIQDMLKKEVMRFAVVYFLLKYPIRKNEVQSAVIEDNHIRLAATDRKSHKYPLNQKLSGMETQIFSYLRNGGGGSCAEEEDRSFQPFEKIDVTNELKSTTTDFTGIPVTIVDLRAAAESHVDLATSDDSSRQAQLLQNALSYVEGHTQGIAQLFYKRNGSESILKPWTSHVANMLNFQDNEAGTDNTREIDDNILNKIKESQINWLKKTRYKLREVQSRSRAPEPKRRKVRSTWSKTEDGELRMCVGHYGTNWKSIMKHSTILQNRYQNQSLIKAAEGLRERWRRHLAKTPEPMDKEDDYDDPVDITEENKGLKRSPRSHPAVAWTSYEDNVLEVGVERFTAISGRINWSAILDNSVDFQRKYNHMRIEKAREALRDRWRRLKNGAGYVQSEIEEPTQLTSESPYVHTYTLDSEPISAHRVKKRKIHRTAFQQLEHAELTQKTMCLCLDGRGGRRWHVVHDQVRVQPKRCQKFHID